MILDSPSQFLPSLLCYLLGLGSLELIRTTFKEVRPETYLLILANLIGLLGLIYLSDWLLILLTWE